MLGQLALLLITRAEWELVLELQDVALQLVIVRLEIQMNQLATD